MWYSKLWYIQINFLVRSWRTLVPINCSVFFCSESILNFVWHICFVKKYTWFVSIDELSNICSFKLSNILQDVDSKSVNTLAHRRAQKFGSEGILLQLISVDWRNNFSVWRQSLMTDWFEKIKFPIFSTQLIRGMNYWCLNCQL